MSKLLKHGLILKLLNIETVEKGRREGAYFFFLIHPQTSSWQGDGKRNILAMTITCDRIHAGTKRP